MRGLLLAQRVSKALATHAKSFPTNSATSPNRPRWLYIAHTRKLAVGESSAEKSAEAVVPAANGRSYRPGSNGYKTSRWTSIGTTANQHAVHPQQPEQPLTSLRSFRSTEEHQMWLSPKNTCSGKLQPPTRNRIIRGAVDPH